MNYLINSVRQALQLAVQEYWDGEKYCGNGEGYGEGFEITIVSYYGKEKGNEIIEKIKKDN